MSALKSSFVTGCWTVGSLADAATLGRLAFMDASCDVVECRVDCWPAAVPQALEALGNCPVPALITVRGPDEGGRHSLTTAERESLYRRFLPQASLLDIEIACLSDFRNLICEARERGVLVVASAHDFVRTPEAEELRRKMESAIRGGADIVKFAATAQHSGDLATLGSLLEEPGHPPLSVMAMGPLGRISRLLMARLGSVLNYGYLDAATVPGQWPAARLRELVMEINT
jgi:3-dehydroquinate dehydratase-1